MIHKVPHKLKRVIVWPVVAFIRFDDWLIEKIFIPVSRTSRRYLKLNNFSLARTSAVLLAYSGLAMITYNRIGCGYIYPELWIIIVLGAILNHLVTYTEKIISDYRRSPTFDRDVQMGVLLEVVPILRRMILALCGISGGYISYSTLEEGLPLLKVLFVQSIHLFWITIYFASCTLPRPAQRTPH